MTASDGECLFNTSASLQALLAMAPSDYGPVVTSKSHACNLSLQHLCTCIVGDDWYSMSPQSDLSHAKGITMRIDTRCCG